MISNYNKREREVGKSIGKGRLQECQARIGVVTALCEVSQRRSLDSSPAMLPWTNCTQLVMWRHLTELLQHFASSITIAIKKERQTNFQLT
jgi:hypothetical protein